MLEGGERLTQVSIKFRWEHPDNGCRMRSRNQFIKEIITAAGSNAAEAKRFARILAKNSPKICQICEADYTLLLS